jgi:hypothetical protein
MGGNQGGEAGLAGGLDALREQLDALKTQVSTKVSQAQVGTEGSGEAGFGLMEFVVFRCSIKPSSSQKALRDLREQLGALKAQVGSGGPCKVLGLY